MKIEPKNFVAIHYTLTLDSGEKVDSTEGGEPLGFIQGAGQIIDGLDKAVLGRSVGDKFNVTVEPKDGYGMPSEDMYRPIPRENFPAGIDLTPGQGFTANGPYGPVSFRVVRVEGDTVIADFNHTLAGQTLHFDVEVVEAREPRAEELASLAMASSCAPDDCGSCGGGCGCS